jgi:hypothetical protein
LVSSLILPSCPPDRQGCDSPLKTQKNYNTAKTHRFIFNHQRKDRWLELVTKESRPAPCIAIKKVEKKNQQKKIKYFIKFGEVAMKTSSTCSLVRYLLFLKPKNHSWMVGILCAATLQTFVPHRLI